MPRRKVEKVDSIAQTMDAIEAAKISYNNILENVKKGIDKEATGSDRINEMKAIMFGNESMPNLIRLIAKLQDMIDKNDFIQQDQAWVSDTENFVE